ncbi:MAG: hypothetical protein HYV09_39065 [Deltaproteobacteria bacterium]|nr:hypothetical protein [Deltaproteobacteria bacterium]
MSAYRSISPAGRESCALLCRKCGARLRLPSEQPEVRCARCDTANPALRAGDDWAIDDLREVAHKAASYGELVAFAESLGIRERCAQIDLSCDGVRCAVSLDINSGSAQGLELSAQTAGFPKMTFLRETSRHVDVKQAGISREVQTGDAAFDAAVYVNTAVSDADALVVLSPPAVRAAIMRLLSEVSEITLNDSGVALSSHRDEPRCYAPATVRAQLEALRVVAGAPRPLSPTVVHDPVARLTLVFTILVMPLGLVSLIASMSKWEPIDVGNVVLLGLVIGLVAAVSVQPLLTRLLRGRSSSHTELAFARFATFVASPLFAIAFLTTLNGRLDRSAELVRDGKVVKVSWDDENSRSQVEVRGTENLDVSFGVYDPKREVKVGDLARVWSRSGALGYAWTTRPSVIFAKTSTFRER